MRIALAQIIKSKLPIRTKDSPKLSEKTMLGNMSDLVFITDPSLKILSLNEAVERSLNISYSQAVNRSLLDLVFLKTLEGKVIDAAFLQADFKDPKSQTKEVTFSTKNSSFPKKVVLGIYPLARLKGNVEQITFVISGLEVAGKGIRKFHPNLERAVLKSQAEVEEFKTNLANSGLVDFRAKFEMIERSEGEILTAIELEDHQIKPTLTLVDTAEIIKKAISSEEPFAAAFLVPIRLVFDNQFDKDALLHVPSGMNIPVEFLTSPYFTVPTDPRWFDYLVQKLLEISIMLASGDNSPFIQVSMAYDEETVLINISVSCKKEISSKLQFLFIEYYGDLSGESNLRLGSGLEGYLAKKVINFLGVNFDVNYNDESGRLIFRLSLPKNVEQYKQG